jgi:hypothetical protein
MREDYAGACQCENCSYKIKHETPQTTDFYNTDRIGSGVFQGCFVARENGFVCGDLRLQSAFVDGCDGCDTYARRGLSATLGLYQLDSKNDRQHERQAYAGNEEGPQLRRPSLYRILHASVLPNALAAVAAE